MRAWWYGSDHIVRAVFTASHELASSEKNHTPGLPRWCT